MIIFNPQNFIVLRIFCIFAVEILKIMESILNLYRKKNVENLIKKTNHLNGDNLDDYYVTRIFKKAKESFSQEEIEEFIEEHFESETLDDDTFSDEVLKNVLKLHISKIKKNIEFPLYVKFKYDRGYWCTKFFEVHIPHFLDCLDFHTRCKYQNVVNSAKNSIAGLEDLIKLQESLKALNDEYNAIVEKIKKLCVLSGSGYESGNIIKIVFDQTR